MKFMKYPPAGKGKAGVSLLHQNAESAQANKLFMRLTKLAGSSS